MCGGLVLGNITLCVADSVRRSSSSRLSNRIDSCVAAIGLIFCVAAAGLTICAAGLVGARLALCVAGSVRRSSSNRLSNRSWLERSTSACGQRGVQEAFNARHFFQSSEAVKRQEKASFESPVGGPNHQTSCR
jgi:hypothetical protein